jgi:hypothetical protein
MWVSWPDINFGLTFTSIVLSIAAAPSDKRSGLSHLSQSHITTSRSVSLGFEPRLGKQASKQ